MNNMKLSKKVFFAVILFFHVNKVNEILVSIASYAPTLKWETKKMIYTWIWHWFCQMISTWMQSLLLGITEKIIKKPSHIMVHAGTNDVYNSTSREILDKLLNLKSLILEKVPDCKVYISTPTLRERERQLLL